MVGVSVTVGVYVLVAEGVSEGVDVAVFVGVLLGVGVVVLNKLSGLLHPGKTVAPNATISIDTMNALCPCLEPKKRLLKILMHKYSPE